MHIISKLVVKIFILVVLSLVPLFMYTNNVSALCDNGKTGPKLGNRLDFLYGGVYPPDFIRTKYNDHNGSCPDEHIAVTILLTFSQVANRDSSVTAILNQMHSQNMYPIIRLYTSYTGSGFTTITEAEAAAAGAGLADLVDASAWNTNEIIVYPGNEINSDAEWPDPATGISYDAQVARVSSFAKAYAAFSKNTRGKYRVYLPPLNAYLGVCQIEDWNYEGLFNQFVNQVRANGGRIDGSAFTVYNADSESIKADVGRLSSISSAKAISSYILSEVGPKLDENGSCRLLDQAEDVDEWKSRMSEVFTRANNNGHADVFLGAERATTSFFLNCDNQLTTFLVVIGDNGSVTIEEEDKIDCDIIQEVGNRPLDKGFYWDERTPCNDVRKDEFHPLRPYPVSPCETRIPQSKPEAPFLIEERPSGSGNEVRANRYINYACGTSIDFTGTESFDPHGYRSGSPNPADLWSSQGTVTTKGTDAPITYAYTVCEPEIYVCRPGETCPELTCYRTLNYEVETDFRDSNLGILGNTQKEYPEKELVNNYLSWYFTGVPQIGNQVPLEPYYLEDENLLINYSGPVRKLLPFDAQNVVKSAIASANGQNKNAQIADVHNYIIGCQKNIDWDYFLEVSETFFNVWFGNIFDTFRFMKLLWDAGQAQTDGFVKLGSLLFEISSRPELLEAQNRLVLIQLIKDRGFEELLEANFEFLTELISLGVENIRRLSAFVSAVKTDVAESCETSTKIQRLDLFDTDPDGTDGEYLPYPEGNLPPDPHSPRYDNFEEFWDDYNNWRGLANTWIGPINLPFPHYLQDIWAQLFPNVPYTSLEDIAGEEFFTGYGQGVGPYSGANGLITAPGQLNIIEAVPAVGTKSNDK